MESTTATATATIPDRVLSCYDRAQIKYNESEHGKMIRRLASKRFHATHKDVFSYAEKKRIYRREWYARKQALKFANVVKPDIAI